MIPKRFAIDYAERCLKLLEECEPIARKHDLLGTFSVMLASSILLVPWERAGRRHPITQEQDLNLLPALDTLKNQKWFEADFWAGRPPGDWRFSRIMNDPNNVGGWADEQGRRSFTASANTIERRRVGEVFRVLRNALAHGNIVYLDENGRELTPNRVEHLAFISRYEESAEQRAQTETYRLVTVRVSDFLRFVRTWAHWVVEHREDGNLRDADPLGDGMDTGIGMGMAVRQQAEGLT